MLAVDHGYFLGPTEKLENPRKVIAPLLRHCDSLMVTRGVQRTSVPATTDVPMVLRVSGGSSIIGDDLSQEDITVSVEDAIRLNASALAMSIFVGSKYEYQTIVNLGKLVSEAEKYGLPVLAVTAVGKELGKDARYLSLACRIAAEQGAHIVKTYYCENFEKVVQSCPVPIIVAGGKKIPERNALELTYNAIKGGAVGVDMGRNIWQSKHPVSMISAVHSIVHQNKNVDQAYSLYKQLVSQEPVHNKPTRPDNQKKRDNQNNKPKPTRPDNQKKRDNQNNKPKPTRPDNQKKRDNQNRDNQNRDNKPKPVTPENQNRDNKPKPVTPENQNRDNKPKPVTPENQNRDNKPKPVTPENQNRDNKPKPVTPENQNRDNKPKPVTPENQNRDNKPKPVTPENQNRDNKPKPVTPENQNRDNKPKPVTPENQNRDNKPKPVTPENQNRDNKPKPVTPENQNRDNKPKPVTPENQNKGNDTKPTNPDNEGHQK